MSQGVVFYTYEAGVHCPKHARERFGDVLDLPGTTDNEGNTLGAMFSWDECVEDQSCEECVYELVVARNKEKDMTDLSKMNQRQKVEVINDSIADDGRIPIIWHSAAIGDLVPRFEVPLLIAFVQSKHTGMVADLHDEDGTYQVQHALSDADVEYIFGIIKERADAKAAVAAQAKAARERAIIVAMQGNIPQDMFAVCEGDNYDFVIGPKIDRVEDAVQTLADALHISWEHALCVVFGTIVDRNT